MFEYYQLASLSYSSSPGVLSSQRWNRYSSLGENRVRCKSFQGLFAVLELLLSTPQKDGEWSVVDIVANITRHHGALCN